MTAALGPTPQRALAGTLAGLALAAIAWPARAADLPLWELGLGVAGLSLPHYRGAERSTRWVLPTPYAVYRGEVLRANRDGVKAMLPGQYPERAFSVEYAAKDNGYALELGRETGVRLRGAETVAALFDEARAAGFGGAYYPVIARLVDR